MADDSNEQGEQASTGGAQAFSQADIDALLNGASESLEEPSSDESAPAPSPAEGPATQEDIDTLVAAAGPVTQNDVDTLVEAAGPGDAPAQGGAAGDGPAGASRLDSMGRPFDEAAAAMQAPIEEERASAQTVSPADTSAASPPQTRPHEFPKIERAAPVQVDPNRVTMLNDVNLKVRLQLGETRMRLEEILTLGEGSVVELDKLAGDPVDVLVNDRLVARGEVLVLNDVFCVRVCEVLSNDPHRITV